MRPHGGRAQTCTPIRRKSEHLDARLSKLHSRRTLDDKHIHPVTQPRTCVPSTQPRPRMRLGKEGGLLSPPTPPPEQGRPQTHQSSSSATFFSSISAKAFAPALPMSFPTRLGVTKGQTRVRAGRDLRGKLSHEPHFLFLFRSLSDTNRWSPCPFPSSPEAARAPFPTWSTGRPCECVPVGPRHAMSSIQPKIFHLQIRNRDP